MKKLILGTTSLLIAAFAMVGLTGTAGAATAGTLFGGAMMQDNEVVLVSDLSDTDTANDFSGIDYDVTMPFDEITHLSYGYNVNDDDCGGGSPRFQLNTDDGNVFVYGGPSPSFTGCAEGDQMTGNLIGNNDACRFDTSQITGSVCSTYEQALALLGDTEITGIQLVVDSGWMEGDQEQTINVDNVMINGMTSDFNTPKTKDECKNGGYKTFSNPEFRNQGECVSYVNRQSR